MHEKILKLDIYSNVERIAIMSVPTGLSVKWFYHYDRDGLRIDKGAL